jgi:hypothetical protein
MEEYLNKMEKMAKRKIDIYSKLLTQVSVLRYIVLHRKHLQEEDELHKKVQGTLIDN